MGAIPRDNYYKGFDELVFFTGRSIFVARNTTARGSRKITFSNDTIQNLLADSWQIAVGDIDGDGNSEILTNNISGNSILPTLSLFRKKINIENEPNVFERYDFSTGNLTYGVGLADLDGDGRKDVIGTNFRGNTFSVMKNMTADNKSSFHFNNSHDFIVKNNPEYVKIADVDGDGKPDILTYSYTSNVISLVKNKTGMGTSVKRVDAEGLFKIFPNPVIDLLNIEISQDVKPSKIEILDIYGRVMSVHDHRRNLSVDVSHLLKGVYFVKCNDLISKFIKQ